MDLRHLSVVHRGNMFYIKFNSQTLPHFVPRGIVVQKKLNRD